MNKKLQKLYTQNNFLKISMSKFRFAYYFIYLNCKIIKIIHLEMPI